MNKTSIKSEIDIRGDFTDLKSISEVLNIEPTRGALIGETIRKTEKIRTFSRWIFENEEEETLDIKKQCDLIMDQLSNKKEKIQFLKEKYDLDIVFEFVIKIRGSAVPAICFELDFIQLTAEIGASIDCDTYLSD